MKLKVIGSGSSGNGYALISNDDILLLECGRSLKEMKETIDFKISNVCGCLVSHSHKDHCNYIKQYMDAVINVYTNDATQIDATTIFGEKPVGLTYGKKYRIGSFIVQPFELVHDVPCCGYLIEHEEMGKLLFITDTEYVPYDFSRIGANHILVECNYDNDKINNNYIKSLRDRVLQTHMSSETCKEFIRNNNTINLNNIVLIHLSDSNGDDDKFLTEVKEIVSCPVYVARKGLAVELSKDIF